MNIRIIAAVLALLLTLVLFGCSAPEGDGDSQSSAQNSVTSNPGTAESVEGTESTGDTASDSTGSLEEPEDPEDSVAKTLEDFKYTEDEDGNVTLTGVRNKDIVACEIPERVVAISKGAFMGCAELESVTFPDTLLSLSIGAFSGCEKLIETVNGVSYVGTWAVDCTEDVTTVALREGTVGIGDSVFAGCGKLTSVTVPSSVTRIGAYAFSRCESLSALVLPDALLSLGEYALFSCKSLTSVAFPNTVTSLDEYTLGECTSLESVTLPTSVTAIEEGAFYGCSALTSVSYAGDAAAWERITMASGNESLTNAYRKG